MNKKVVWLPYDFDTALGINNEGALVFSYDLEDIDHLTGGADVFNGQDSVVWKNIRATFADELRTMYQTLRSNSTSTTGLSYKAVEKMFEDHQNKWPEAIFNEDAWFKYLEPLINDADASYLSMLQGSKAEQRKWWLYNRFRYIDSKYNAGDALTDYIQVRGYAKDNITITPYATIYPTVKFGSYLVQARGTRGVATTLVCPLDNVNDTEIYIYSASQLASVGDLSGLKVGFADFSRATKLQSIKLGDSDSSYSNPNLKELYLGNNVLLQTIDVRRCTALGSGDQKTVDISGCSNVKNVYFDNTQITGVTLPNGGVLSVLHLPSTITNLTIQNQPNITDLVADVSNVTTLRIENCPTVNTKTMLNTVPANTRVRLVGFVWEAQDSTEIESLLDTLDTMRGLDINGNNLETAYVEGTIHTYSLTGAQIAAYNERYPYLSVTADHVTSYLTYKSWDGATTVATVTCIDGTPQESSPSGPVRTATAQYNYTFVGWNLEMDASTNDASAITNVIADRTVYAAYSRTVRSHTITFVRASADGGGTLQSSAFPYGSTPSYTGATPTTTQGDATDYPFEGWTPAISTVTGPTTYTAKFGSPVEDVEITDSWDTIIANIDNGTYATKYKIGNYKPLDLGTEGIVNMQIAAFDTDLLESGGTAPITFVAKELLTTQNSDGGSLTTGWTSAPTYTYLSGTVYDLIPTNVKSRICTVKKKANTYTNGTSNPIVGDEKNVKLWIPSLAEIYGTTSSSEWQGISYKKIFKTKIKYISGTETASAWWLRTSGKGSSGWGYHQFSATGTYGVRGTLARACLGFCLGLEPETITDSWETILANENPSSTYSIGDTKYLDLGTEGMTLMEIVAFDADDLADGTGKAKITWISKNLLKTKHRMNPSNNNNAEGTGAIGGWDKSEMKSFLLNTIAPLVPSNVRNGVVAVKKYSRIFNTSGIAVNDVETSETFWIPSRHEMFDGTTEYYETQGPRYNAAFPDVASRVKGRVGASVAINWWVRTAANITDFNSISASGSSSNYYAYRDYGIALGFCTN